MRRFICIIAAVTGLICCNKNSRPDNRNDVEIYLLKSYELVPGMCKVNQASVTLEDTPFIKNDEIEQYTPSACEYRFSPPAASKIAALLPRTPFAVTVDRKIIFTGFNMPPYISSSCDHSIVMTSSGSSSRTIQLRLGYPGIALGTQIDDQRNDARLIAAFLQQRKLN
jgi:hypothetical protein